MAAALERCVVLGKEFGRLEMRDHLQLLREFYVAARNGVSCANGWTQQFVDDWLAVLRLPPFESQLPVLPGGAMCPTCHADPGEISSRRTVRVYPGGAVMRCDGCGKQWLEQIARW